ncbi:MAG TPA: hypothetical protein ENJ56_01100, partial [Anaerolineae bacterium]|nr:hypothetical protein [Anaerolineae bacterium]
IAICERWLTLDNWREETHRRLMRLYALDGQRAAALAQFEQCKQLLNQELGVEPGVETVVLLEKIRKDSLRDARHYADEDKQVIGHNLPRPATLLIGRNDLLSKIILRLHDDDCQLLTLVGAGGMGKTRLAIAAGLAISSGRLVRWVDMSGVAAGEIETPLIATLVEALKIELQPQPVPLQQLINWLKQQPPILLIVDNLEQLINRVHVLSELLNAVPTLKLLATSRERLNLSQEWLIEISGLQGEDAAALFVANAKRVQQGFDPDSYTDTIQELCGLVGGMPLALELMASWLRLLDPDEIVAELRQSIDIISTQSRDVPQRHRSLRAVFDYSWAQLSAEERTILPRLAVFRGGFDRVAASEITGASLFLLSSLIDKSLLHREKKDRYQLHVAVRQYAASRMHAVEKKETHTHHATYFLAWLEAAEMGKISAELANLHHAWQWTIANNIPLALRFIDPLANFFAHENRTTETVDLFTKALAAIDGDSADALTRASWQRRLGEAHFRLGNMTICRDLHITALRDIGAPLPSNRVALGLALSRQMAQQLVHRRRLPQPSREGERAKLEEIRLLERLGQIFFLESDSMMSGYTSIRGLNLAETLPVSAELARYYGTACLAASMMARPKLATVYQVAALKAIDETDDPATVAWVLEALSVYNSGIGNWQQVWDWIEQALALADQIGDQRRRDECLVMHATGACFTGKIRSSFQIWHAMFLAAKARADNQVMVWSMGGMIDMLTKLGELERHAALIAEIIEIGSDQDKNDSVSAMARAGFWAMQQVRLEQFDDAQRTIAEGAALTEKAVPTAFTALGDYSNLIEAGLELFSHDPQRYASTGKDIKRMLKAYKKYAHVFPIGRPNLAFCQGWQQWLAGDHKQAQTTWAQGLAEARRLKMVLEEAKLLSVIGRTAPIQNPHALDQAHHLFVKTEAKGELKRWLLEPTIVV